jgi:putative flavoprotein involved in K+ transport
VIGAGQAGLATSHLLRERGVEHLVLEQGGVGETWRSQRWDGFYLNTPNWATQLPGRPYDRAAPDGFASLPEIIALFDDYARAAPVRTGTRVTRVRPDGGAWIVETRDDSLRAANVVLAVGAFQRPSIPAAARDLPRDLLQLHSSGYRNPAQLPDGTVLVAGSAQSGCQIAEELLEAGRDVVLATGRCGWYPRRYRGRDLIAWMLDLGMLDDTVESIPAENRRGCNPSVSGNDDGHDCHARWLGGRGATLAGRVREIERDVVFFAPDLTDSLAFADEFAARLMRRVDEHVETRGIDAADPENRGEIGEPATVSTLPTGELGAVIWATGYGPDFSWVDAPLEPDGRPVQTHGVGAAEGLYFVGLPWLRKRKSALIYGVGEDAEHVVTHLVETRLPGRAHVPSH